MSALCQQVLTDGSAATAISAFAPVWRPRTALSKSTSTRPRRRSRPGRTIARRSLCNQVQPSCSCPGPDPLQSQCTRPVLLAGEPPHGSKPTLEGLAGVLKYCACCRRGLMPAARALQQRRPHRPSFVMPASGTTKTLRPAELTQILPTGLLVGETRLELGQIPGIIFHFPRSYILGSPESSEYPSNL